MSDESSTPQPAETPAAETTSAPAAAAAPTEADVTTPPTGYPATPTTPPTAPGYPATPTTPPTAPMAAAPAAAPPAEPARRKTVEVPSRILWGLAACLLAGLAFAGGYAIGDDNGSNTTAAIATPGQVTNPAPGNQNTPAPTLPQNPRTTSGAFLGVATQQGTDGLEISQVVDGSAAANAGLQVGDVITAFDGQPVTTPAQLGNAVAAHNSGDTVRMTITRNGNSRTVTVTLGARTQSN